MKNLILLQIGDMKTPFTCNQLRKFKILVKKKKKKNQKTKV